MKFINKIEIKYFRSFSDKAIKIEYIKDLNIFSGGNDSGKSNILRALNLFFNGQVGHGEGFVFERDFSKFQLENSNKKSQKKKEQKIESKQKDLFIEIKIHFDLSEKPYGEILPKKFWISKKWTKTKSGELNDNIKTTYLKENHTFLETIKGTNQYANTLNSLTRSITTFQNKIEFFYVPAIKDYSFFKEIYALLQEKLNSESGKIIEESKNALQETVRKETEKFFNKFKKSTGLNAAFLIEHELLDFRKNIEVDTGKSILLTSRGDGVQARLIPDILDELSNKGKYMLWGFEEPENSYEYKHAKKLANDFYDNYSNDRQIFITTHSKEFLGIQNSEGKNKLSIYRVFKDYNEQSKIEKYDENNGFSKEKVKEIFLTGINENQLNTEKKNILQNIYDDLGIIDEARIISDLESKISTLNLEKNDLREIEEKYVNILEEKEKLQKENNELIVKLGSVPVNNFVIFCEDKNEELFNGLALSNIVFIGLQGKRYVFESVQKTPNEQTNIRGLMDRDYMTENEIEYIENNTNTRILDYYCIENYLYHPSNLEEYFQSKSKSFDIVKYKNNIIQKKNKEWNTSFNRDSLPVSRRDGYGNVIEFFEIGTLTKSSLFTIEEDLNTDDFGKVYKHFSMKKYKPSFPVLQNINPIELTQTQWFKNKIGIHISSMGIQLIYN